MNNLRYIEDLYAKWKDDPAAVDKVWAAYFEEGRYAEGTRPEEKPAKRDMAYKQSRVDSLLWAFRDTGYLHAKLNPLGGDYGPAHDYLPRSDVEAYEELSPGAFGLSDEDLETVFFAGRAMKPPKAPLHEILAAFTETYCGSIGIEFLHIQNKQIRSWLIEKMESTRNRMVFDAGLKRIILEDLLKTEALERTLGRSFMGQKRFSLEGSEAIIPGLHFLVDSAGKYDIGDFVIGTTHRGRLAVLSTILHMTPQEIFSRFEENFLSPSSCGGGDVKYHIGYETDHILDDGGTAHISMVANASHLESVDATVQGKARALQDRNHDSRRKHVLPILLHGDAAFCGQGVVAETFNLSRLPGYTTGGTIHIIINNQIGFTTSARDARSTFFPTDVAKAFGVPVFHVNGDDPEALVYACDVALQFRQKFGRDFVVDVFCYRRHGHNEADEPSFTHPHMYHIIEKRPSVASIYGEQCAENQTVSRQEQESIVEEYDTLLKKALEKSRSEPVSLIDTTQGPDWAGFVNQCESNEIDTGVAESILNGIAKHITAAPEQFHIHPILARTLERKRKTFEENSIVDWAFAEALAFGSLLLEGIPVRFSGEDCVRGTFSQRHLTWWDIEADEPKSYTAMQTLDPDQARLSAIDSPLSEYSVLGFEYGYSLVSPVPLVIWEAQFGDFANGAQVVIDNYVTSAENKWGRLSGIVLLLPHGCEGQGPDHSSAHLERFLQLAACDNIRICNLTLPAQYFHVLRRQVKGKCRKPLVIMTPKSLLRHPKVVSGLADLVGGKFRAVLDDSCDPEPIRRIIFCSGKVYYDLLARREDIARTNTALIRIEQLYPFPESEVADSLKRYPQANEVIWCQEEPKNFGAWSYIRERFTACSPRIEIRYLGRDESSSGGTGSFKQHQQEQKKLIEDAFGRASAKKPKKEKRNRKDASDENGS